MPGPRAGCIQLTVLKSGKFKIKLCPLRSFLGTLPSPGEHRKADITGHKECGPETDPNQLW